MLRDSTPVNPGRIGWAVLAVLLIVSPVWAQQTRPGNVGYFDLFDQALQITRSQMPTIIASAEAAAKEMIAHEQILVKGSQHGFEQELGCRAGGLMGLKPFEYRNHDKGGVLMLGVTNELSEGDRDNIKNAREEGIYIVAFGSREAFEKEAIKPDAIIDNHAPFGLHRTANGKAGVCPVDSMLNIVNAWVWTGELVGACTRQGKMPVLFKSYGLPGGPERQEKYRNQVLHADLTVKPIAPGVIGRAYLDSIQAYLLSFRNTQPDRIAKTLQWWRESKPEETTVLLSGGGHLLEYHFNETGNVKLNEVPFNWPSGLDAAVEKAAKAENGFIFFVGYQKPPETLIAKAAEHGFRLSYLSVLPDETVQPADDIIYLNPGWPVTDGCVQLLDYDVPILPASGIVNGTIYWALLAEVLEPADLHSSHKRGSDPVSADVYRRWQERHSYYALIEIIDAHLANRSGHNQATKQDVLKYLGEPNWGTINQDPKKEWAYQGSGRNVPVQDKVIFAFNDQDEIVSIDWISE